MVAASGVEPPTFRVWTGRSSQLSYTATQVISNHCKKYIIKPGRDCQELFAFFRLFFLKNCFSNLTKAPHKGNWFYAAADRLSASGSLNRLSFCTLFVNSYFKNSPYIVNIFLPKSGQAANALFSAFSYFVQLPSPFGNKKSWNSFKTPLAFPVNICYGIYRWHKKPTLWRVSLYIASYIVRNAEGGGQSLHAVCKTASAAKALMGLSGKEDRAYRQIICAKVLTPESCYHTALFLLQFYRAAAKCWYLTHGGQKKC